PEKSARTNVARNSVAPERSASLKFARSSLARLKSRSLKSRAERSHATQSLVAPERKAARSSARKVALANAVATTSDESAICQRMGLIPGNPGQQHSRSAIKLQRTG